MKRAALYTRVSTTDQSTALQNDEAERFIAARGWQATATFEDVGQSGAKGRRPGLDALHPSGSAPSRYAGPINP